MAKKGIDKFFTGLDITPVDIEASKNVAAVPAAEVVKPVGEGSAPAKRGRKPAEKKEDMKLVTFQAPRDLRRKLDDAKNKLYKSSIRDVIIEALVDYMRKNGID